MDTLHTTAPKSRVRRSADQWRTILQRFERSGLSARAFCRREGLVVSSLQRWLRQLTVESTARRPDFVELRPTPPPFPAPSRGPSSWNSPMAPRYGSGAESMLASIPVRRILAYREPTDMRKGFCGLVALVRNTLDENPMSGTLYVFANRRANYLKLIYWDRTGFALFAKRLERGRFVFPGSERTQELSDEQLRLILDGIVLGAAVPMR